VGEQRVFETVEKKLDKFDKDIQFLVSHAKDTETDPALLLARAGMFPAKGLGYALIGGRFYVFPRNPEAENELIKSGLRKEALSPVISAYVVNGPNPPGIQ
jgi:hypothetical protein